jgi:hypothetical protein
MNTNPLFACPRTIVIMVALLVGVQSVSATPPPDCPTVAPKALELVSPSVRKTPTGFQYSYVLLNDVTSQDALDALVVTNLVVDTFTGSAPAGWTALTGRAAHSWYATAPALTSMHALSVVLPSSADLNPGSQVRGLQLNSGIGPGLVAYRVGVRRDTSSHYKTFYDWARNQSPDASAEGVPEFVAERYMELCGPATGDIPELFRYGVTTGPSALPSLQAQLTTNSEGISQILVSGRKLGDVLAAATSAVLFNGERRSAISLTQIDVADINGDGARDALLGLGKENLEGFTCRTSAALVDVYAGSVPVARAALNLRGFVSASCQ